MTGVANGLFLAIAAIISAVLIVLLRPLLVRYASARPNARSSHRIPTPQGAGIAVIGSTTIVVGFAIALFPRLLNGPDRLLVILVTGIALALVGAIDDIRPINALSRLLIQFLLVAIVVAVLPEQDRILPILPWWIERASLLIGGVWFVNLVNFMDGIDWMTVVEVVPITAALAAFGLMGALPENATLLACVLCGALVGFAPFNRPVARVFLGDVGSLPIGLLLGWLLTLLAGAGHLTAAVLLPLYYLADATLTLLRRAINGERITQAHRSHFYQRALDGGLSVYQIVGRVFGANIMLVGLATLTLKYSSFTVQLIALAVGGALIGILLWSFNRTDG